MIGHRVQDVWREQCAAARRVLEQHGLLSALDYLIGEKLMTYAETAARRAEFARELPSFVAEIRSIFSPQEIRLYLEHLERMDSQEEEAVTAEGGNDDLTIERPEERAAAKLRLTWLKEILTAHILGTA